MIMICNEIVAAITQGDDVVDFRSFSLELSPPLNADAGEWSLRIFLGNAKDHDFRLHIDVFVGQSPRRALEIIERWGVQPMEEYEAIVSNFVGATKEFLDKNHVEWVCWEHNVLMEQGFCPICDREWLLKQREEGKE